MSDALEKELRALKKLPENQICPNCLAKNKFGHENICVPTRTFVCSNCKSAHQAFSQRVKSITMSTWTKEEVKSLHPKYGGSNNNAIATYLYHYKESALPRPRINDDHTVWKRFIQQVYIDKRFYRANREDSEEEKESVSGGRSVSDNEEDYRAYERPEEDKIRGKHANHNRGNQGRRGGPERHRENDRYQVVEDGSPEVNLPINGDAYMSKERKQSEERYRANDRKAPRQLHNHRRGSFSSNLGSNKVASASTDLLGEDELVTLCDDFHTLTQTDHEPGFSSFFTGPSSTSSHTNTNEWSDFQIGDSTENQASITKKDQWSEFLSGPTPAIGQSQPTIAPNPDLWGDFSQSSTVPVKNPLMNFTSHSSMGAGASSANNIRSGVGAGGAIGGGISSIMNMNRNMASIGLGASPIISPIAPIRNVGATGNRQIGVPMMGLAGFPNMAANQSVHTGLNGGAQPMGSMNQPGNGTIPSMGMHNMHNIPNMGMSRPMNSLGMSNPNQTLGNGRGKSANQMHGVKNTQPINGGSGWSSTKSGNQPVQSTRGKDGFSGLQW